ncbi:MAG: hypothetical protein QOE31_1693, partial [Solirubrobacteraceae bacterium]|nr:hypothetical protein [Solirubrobacteraceae bacterium]
MLSRRLRLARRLAGGEPRGARLGHAVLDRRRPKLLASATRLAPRRAAPATVAAAVAQEGPASVPSPELVAARPQGVSDAAARWLLFGEKPAEMLPFMGGPAVGADVSPAGAAAAAPAERPRRGTIARGRVLEGPAPSAAAARTPAAGPGAASSKVSLDRPPGAGTAAARHEPAQSPAAAALLGPAAPVGPAATFDEQPAAVSESHLGGACQPARPRPRLQRLSHRPASSPAATQEQTGAVAAAPGAG